MTEPSARTYTVRMDVAAPLARRRIWSRLVWLGGSAAVAGVALSLFTVAGVSAVAIGGAVGICVVSLAFAGWRAVAREVNALASYRLTLGEGSLRRVVDGVAPAELARDEVTKITEGPFGLVVEGAGRSVFVPAELDGYEEARRHLMSWRPLTSPDRGRIAQQKGLGVLLGVALVEAWGASGWVTSPAARVAATVALYALLAVFLWQTLRNPDAPRSLKRAVVIMAVIMGLSPVSRWLMERGIPEIGIVPPPSSGARCSKMAMSPAGAPTTHLGSSAPVTSSHIMI